MAYRCTSIINIYAILGIYKVKIAEHEDGNTGLVDVLNDSPWETDLWCTYLDDLIDPAIKRLSAEEQDFLSLLVRRYRDATSDSSLSITFCLSHKAIEKRYSSLIAICGIDLACRLWQPNEYFTNRESLEDFLKMWIGLLKKAVIEKSSLVLAGWV